MRGGHRKRGFTLVELLVGLMVTSIIMTAVATLAHGLGRLNDSSSDSSYKQAQLRFTTVRLSELLRNCKLLCGMPGGDLAIWRGDDNSDDQMNIDELVYIEAGPAGDYLRLCEFSSVAKPVINLTDIRVLTSNWWSAYGATEQYVSLIPQCSNVTFGFNEPGKPVPQRRFVSISFDVVEDGAVRHYQVNAVVRG